MNIDGNVFFREATLRICGSLEPEEFLEDSYRYLSEIIPIEQMALSYYDPKTGQQTILAEVSVRGSRLGAQRRIQPRSIRPYTSRPGLETLIIERAELHPTAQPWIAAGRLDKDASLMVMRVFVHRDITGTVVFVAPKNVKYTREHQALVNALRVLQESEIERDGGTDPIRVDIRVIAATHQDLDKMVKQGQFRQDLY